MQERNLQLTQDNLINFLDFVAEKGLMKKDTAVSYKKACRIVLGILDETEAADLSKINLEKVILRHRNLAAGKVSPATLKSYEGRVRAAVNGFFEYAKDPSSWKPAVQQRISRAARAVVSPAKKSKEVEGRGTPIQPSIHIDFQVHISPEATPEQIDQIFASMRRHLYEK